MGKVIGGGHPLSALAGRADIMAHFDSAKVGSDGFMPQVGTLSGNPIAAVAGLATLEILKRAGAYEQIHATGNAIRSGLDQSLRDAGIPAVVKGEGVMFDVYFTQRSTVDDYRATLDTDPALGRRFNALLRERGIFKSDGKFYISLAHDARDVEQTLSAFREAAQILANEPAMA
jgi:glutamate-1-semialdehyde 2,1-aminomutase